MQQPDATTSQGPSHEELERAASGGASWFYWIAGLSIVNSAIVLFGGEWSFIVGLGVTQIVDAIVAGIIEEVGTTSMVPKLIGFGIAAAVAGIFVFFGWFANRRHAWAFIVGMVLYVFDGMLFLLVGDWLSIGFHGFALFCIWAGFAACRKLAEAAPEPSATTPVGAEPIVP